MTMIAKSKMWLYTYVDIVYFCHIKNVVVYIDIVYLPCSKKELHHIYMQQNLAKSIEFSAELLQDTQDYCS